MNNSWGPEEIGSTQVTQIEIKKGWTYCPQVQAQSLAITASAISFKSGKKRNQRKPKTARTAFLSSALYSYSRDSYYSGFDRGVFCILYSALFKIVEITNPIRCDLIFRMSGWIRAVWYMGICLIDLQSGKGTCGSSFRGWHCTNGWMSLHYMQCNARAFRWECTRSHLYSGESHCGWNCQPIILKGLSFGAGMAGIETLQGILLVWPA